MRIDGGFHKISNADSRYLDRVLKGHENASPRTFLGRHGQKILSHILDCAFGDRVLRFPGEHGTESALSGTVRPHKGVNLPFSDFEVYALEDFLSFDSGFQTLYFKYDVRHISICLYIV